jgi:hypothetical protein
MYKTSKMMNFSTVAAVWIGALICSAAGCAEPPQPQAPEEREEREAQEVKPAEPLNTILATKLVKVCGRRANLGARQSWWVDTGIYVTAGTQVGVSHANPVGSIQPWIGGAFWPPAGNTSSIGWGDSLAYYSGLVTTPLNVSFSLIAKVGRSGNAIHVGSSSSFVAPATGTLYLAVNDGVNFEDNAGQWNLNLTYPTTVNLGTGHGGLNVQADRLNTSLVDRWGVVLTMETSNIHPTHLWSPTYIGNVERAFQAVENRLGVPFKQVFGGLELRLVATNTAGGTTRAAGHESYIQFGLLTQTSTRRNDDRTYGQISPPDPFDYYTSTSTLYGFNNAGDRAIENTIIHELGHILEYRTMGATNASSRMRAVWQQMGLPRMRQFTNLAPDSPADVGIFWESQFDVSDATEIVADAFLNWVRGSYVATSPHAPGVSAFWNGGTYNNVTSAGWLGTNGFRATAAAFAAGNGIPQLLTALGTGDPINKRGGDPDPNCAF